MQITLSQEEIEVAVHDYIRRMGISCPVGEMSFQRSLNPTTIWAQIVVTTDAITPVAYPNVCSDAIPDKDDTHSCFGVGAEDPIEGLTVHPTPANVTPAATFTSGDSNPPEVEPEPKVDGADAIAEEDRPEPVVAVKHSLFG